jgi:hypothetical protein
MCEAACAASGSGRENMAKFVIECENVSSGYDRSCIAMSSDFSSFDGPVHPFSAARAWALFYHGKEEIRGMNGDILRAVRWVVDYFFGDHSFPAGIIVDDGSGRKGG